MRKQLTFIDLFAGAGGLSEGFIREGFSPVAHIEKDKSPALTLRTRLAYHHLKKEGKIDIYYEYLQGKISRETLYSYVPSELFQTVINQEISTESINSIFRAVDGFSKSVDVIIGGPPCQAYSVAGRSCITGKGRNIEEDCRLYMYVFYAMFLERYSPELFVFENVEGLLHKTNEKYFENMVSLFEKAGYSVKYRVLDSSDYGVPQRRKRVFIVGTRKGIDFEFPEKTVQKPATVKDAFHGLPHPGEGICSYTAPASGYLKKTGIRTDEPFTTQHITRKINERDMEIYRIAIRKLLEEGERLSYSQLPDHLKTHRNQKSFQDRFKVLRPDLPSHTVMAHLSKDGHYYIYPDAENPRSITVREAARLQTFPDSYHFEGGMTSAFQQIGNAVPVLLASEIARAVKKYIKMEKKNETADRRTLQAHKGPLYRASGSP